MAVREKPLKDLLSLTKDGEWGSEVPVDGAVEMRVIRGADYDEVRCGDFRSVPVRYIAEANATRKQLRPCDIIIETAGGTKGRPTGRTVFLKKRHLDSCSCPITCASFSRFLRVDPEQAVPEYVYWYLQNLYAQGGMEQHQVQHTGISRFQYTKFAESTLIPLPSAGQQHAIAHILGTLDDKIELNRRTNETLEAMARAIFKSWFIDFDPVHQNAARVRNRPSPGRRPPSPSGRGDGGEGAPRSFAGCLDAETARLFPAKFQDSELGKVPEGWEPSTVGAEFDLTMGQSPPGETYNEVGEGLPFYQGRADFGWRYPTRRISCTAPTRLANAGDTLVSVRAPVGDVNMADEKCCIGRGVAAVRHKNGSRSYTYYVMRSLADVFAHFEADGTVFGCIGKKDFHAIQIVAPPPDLVQAFEQLAGSLDQRVAVNEQQGRVLAAVRDALLPRLLSGGVRLPVTGSS